MNPTKNQPIVKNKSGRFQLSIWKRKRLIKAKNDYDVEREIETVRACIQHSRYNKATDQWENQNIWCSPEDLHNLAQVLDNTHGETGTDKPKPQ